MSSQLIPYAVPVPADSRIASVYGTTHLADAFAIGLPAHAPCDAETLARFVIEGTKPVWLRGLLWLRDRMVAPWGIKSSAAFRASAGERIDFFRVHHRSGSEVVLGEDDAHLDFRVSVLVQRGAPPGSEAVLVMSTVVHCHNAFGRLYITLIAPFHRLVVRTGLRRAAQRGWRTDGLAAAGTHHDGG